MARKRKAVHDKHGRLMPASPSTDVAFRNFWKGVDRDEMQAVLAESGNANFRALSDAMLDPRFARYSTAALCRKIGVTLNEISDFWRDHRVAAGTMRMVNHLPDVMEDVAVDAKSTMEVCPRCNGDGKEPQEKKIALEVTIEDVQIERPACLQCDGSGKIRKPGDKASRELMFETVGMIRKQKGPLIAFQQNFNSGDWLKNITDFSDKLIEGEK